MSPLDERALDVLRRWMAGIADDQVAKANEQREWMDQDTAPLSRDVYLRLCRTGVLASHKVGKRILVHRDEMNRFIRTFPSAAAERAEKEEDEIDRELLALDLHPRAPRTPAKRKERNKAA